MLSEDDDEERRDEAHIPTKQPQAVNEARLPGPEINTRRSRRAAVASPEGSPQAECLRAVPTSRTSQNLPHLTTRATVEALRGADRVMVGRRTSPLRLTFVDTVAGHPVHDHRLLFAIGRNVGNAVCRNRCRRRVRAAFHEVAHGVAPGRVIPNGAFLFRPTAAIAELPFTTVKGHVLALLDQLDVRLTDGSVR